MNDTARLQKLAARPQLVFRVAFAGRKELDAEEERRLDAALDKVFNTIGKQLAAITPGIPVRMPGGAAPIVSAFFSKQPPLLRLVTGLCEGADTCAAAALTRLCVEPDDDAPDVTERTCLHAELAAVLPFDALTYRNSRPPWFRAEFDRQLARCKWVLELDGIYDKPAVETALSKNRRGRAYRAQSAFLLRHGDILVAALDPDDSAKAGGTMESIREALPFGSPVILIHTGTGGVFMIEPEDHLPSVIARAAPPEQVWQSTLRRWIVQLVADPDAAVAPENSSREKQREHAIALLDEFFDNAEQPPTDGAGHRKPTIRERVWQRFEMHFRKGKSPAGDDVLACYGGYRQRARDLNYHYTGLYRGAFLVNYLLAVLTVFTAVASLALLAIALNAAPTERVVGEDAPHGAIPSGNVNDAMSVNPKRSKVHAMSPLDSAPANGGPHEEPHTLLLWLLALAGVKVVLLSVIVLNTRHANSQKWNDRAVAYRYLAERIRAMYYLPLVGSHRPPAAATPLFAERAFHQSDVDWLFDSIVRAVSPADMTYANDRRIPAHDGLGEIEIKKSFTLNAAGGVTKVRDRWIVDQAAYHERNGSTLERIHECFEKIAFYLSPIVIIVVLFDVGLIASELAQVVPETVAPVLRILTPVLIAVTALLPAVVASLNGIRFQSECKRLADRSNLMRVMLVGQRHARAGDPAGQLQLANAVENQIATARKYSSTDIGSWSHDALRFTERVAKSFLQEAAEWSVLYAKEVSDPG